MTLKKSYQVYRDLKVIEEYERMLSRVYNLMVVVLFGTVVLAFLAQ